MARAAVVTTMADVYEKAETPLEMQTFISSVLGLQKLQDFLAYAVRKDYPKESCTANFKLYLDLVFFGYPSVSG